MMIRDFLAHLLDITFPAFVAPPRQNLIDELLSGNHSPKHADYDDGILESLNGRALFAYHDEHVRAGIKSLKYDGNADVALWFAECARGTIASIVADTASYQLLIVPIPITFSRHLERGYNQSALIVRAIIEIFGDKINSSETCLVRSAFSQSQTKARTRSERAKNIRGAFEVAQPFAVLGRDVLIVDDVITTGSTIREATSVLLAAGARSVRCFALAH